MWRTLQVAAVLSMLALLVSGTDGEQFGKPPKESKTTKPANIWKHAVKALSIQRRETTAVDSVSVTLKIDADCASTSIESLQAAITSKLEAAGLDMSLDIDSVNGFCGSVTLVVVAKGETAASTVQEILARTQALTVDDVDFPVQVMDKTATSTAAPKLQSGQGILAAYNARMREQLGEPAGDAEEAEPTFAVQTEPWVPTTSTTTTASAEQRAECVEGETGPGTGNNWCNTCTCVGGVMSMCTKMGCRQGGSTTQAEAEAAAAGADAVQTRSFAATNAAGSSCLGRFRGPLGGMRGSVQGIANVEGSSAATCGFLCDTTKSKFGRDCLSFSYRADKGRCWLFMTNKIEVGKQIKAVAEYDHYYFDQTCPDSEIMLSEPPTSGSSTTPSADTNANSVATKPPRGDGGGGLPSFEAKPDAGAGEIGNKGAGTALIGIAVAAAVLVAALLIVRRKRRDEKLRENYSTLSPLRSKAKGGGGSFKDTLHNAYGSMSTALSPLLGGNSMKQSPSDSTSTSKSNRPAEPPRDYEMSVPPRDYVVDGVVDGVDDLSAPHLNSSTGNDLDTSNDYGPPSEINSSNISSNSGAADGGDGGAPGMWFDANGAELGAAEDLLNNTASIDFEDFVSGCDSLPRPRTSSFVFTAGTTSEDGTEDGRPGLHAVGFNDLPDDVGAAGATPTPVPAPRPSELMQDMFDGLDADTSDVESLQAMDPANGLNNDIEVVADYDRFTSTVM